MPPKFKKYLFGGLFLIFACTFFSRNNFRNASEVIPEVLREPIQSEPDSRAKIKFSAHGYAYDLTPLFNYEINALVVGKMDYGLFNIYKYDQIFPIDLCLIWGNNVASKVYRNKAVQFSQDCRWCWVSWCGEIDFDLSALSNNHLLVNQSALLKKLKGVLRGDQIKIKGKLVNVLARPIAEPGASGITWNTSISRADSGAGACEVIYAEEVQILKKANPVSRVLFGFSFYGLIILAVWNIINFFRPARPGL